jgi:hypothetical protein
MKTYFILLCSLIFSTSALGWGRIGHMTVGRIAENHVSAESRKKIAEILGTDTLAQVSNWADEIKSDPKWRYTAGWHYANMEEGQDYKTSKKNSHGDILRAISLSLRVLKDSKATVVNKQCALKWLVHLMGDLHQPMHMGYASDKGGNNFKVRWLNRPTSLHEVWDDNLIELQKLSFSEYATFIDHADKTTSSDFMKGDILSWAMEGRSFLAGAYDYPKGPYAAFAYSYAHLGDMNAQLLKAGVRLAGLLDEVFSDADVTRKTALVDQITKTMKPLSFKE